MLKPRYISSSSLMMIMIQGGGRANGYGISYRLSVYIYILYFMLLSDWLHRRSRRIKMMMVHFITSINSTIISAGAWWARRRQKPNIRVEVILLLPRGDHQVSTARQIIWRVRSGGFKLNSTPRFGGKKFRFHSKPDTACSMLQHAAACSTS